MNVFMQGMRRSGTTVVYDLFLEDGRFDCFYEPLAAARPSTGGGSGAHDFDLFESVRRKREELAALWPEPFDPELLNHGAPREPALELEEDLPPLVQEYLRSLIAGDRPAAVKFTRMAAKVPVLHELDPTAHLLHLVRDPRSVAASYLFGKNARNRGRFTDETAFFTRASEASAWSSRAFSDLLLTRDEYAGLGQLTDLERILLLWGHAFRTTHHAGSRLFGDRYRVVRHEELRERPEPFIDGLYDLLGLAAPARVHEWGRATLRPPSAPFAAEDPRWDDAFDRLELRDLLRTAGYVR